ncbi:MAG: hypothetical protein B7Y39_16725 [Bdellovibrio sp. 28-41-41]|nr:MAG: hypothetical protein B7Y39_16725 [Bdellovibrio sp. 28-41-41]
MENKNTAASYMNPYLAGTLLGTVLFTAFALTHSGLGASGAISRIQVFLTKIISSSHVDQVGYFATMGGGDRNALDHSSVLMFVGTFVGGVLSAKFHNRFRAEVCKGPNLSNIRRFLFALLGGIFMGYGARLARGCTSGQALSGGAVLSVGSWAFMLSVFLGGYLVAYFVRRLWN